MRTPSLHGRHRWVVSTLAAATLALAPVVSLAAPAPTPLERAQAHLDAEEYGQAGEVFSRYYNDLPAHMRADATGEFVVLKAAAAYAKAWEATQDIAELRRSLHLLQAFVDDVVAAHGADTNLRTAAQAEIDRITPIIEDADKPAEPAAVPAEPEPEPEPEAEPESESEPEPDPTTGASVVKPPTGLDAPPPRDQIGLALLIAGGVVTTGGVVTMILGPIQHDRYDRQLSEQEAQSTEGPDDGYLARRREAQKQVDGLRTNLLIGGAVVTAVGIGAVVWGGVRLARRTGPRRATAVRVAPRVGAGTVGVAARGRF